MVNSSSKTKLMISNNFKSMWCGNFFKWKETLLILINIYSLKKFIVSM
jgi:hypothetical protein